MRRAGGGDVAAGGGPGTRFAPAVASPARRRPGGAAERCLPCLGRLGTDRRTGGPAMTARAALLDLSPGVELLLGGSVVQVEWVEPHHGQVLLCGLDGER